LRKNLEVMNRILVKGLVNFGWRKKEKKWFVCAWILT
jgi:hypothetical protein